MSIDWGAELLNCIAKKLVVTLMQIQLCTTALRML